MRKQLFKSVFYSIVAGLAYVIVVSAVFSFEAIYASTGNDESWWKYQFVYDNNLSNKQAVNPLHDKEKATTNTE